MHYANVQGIEVLLCHAPYTLNACSATPETREFARMVFKSDIEMLEHYLYIKVYRLLLLTLHPMIKDFYFAFGFWW